MRKPFDPPRKFWGKCPYCISGLIAAPEGMEISVIQCPVCEYVVDMETEVAKHRADDVYKRAEELAKTIGRRDRTIEKLREAMGVVVGDLDRGDRITAPLIERWEEVLRKGLGI